MKDNIVILHEQPKEIDLSYFDNYGGHNYSESYRGYTVSPEQLIGLFVDCEIEFETLLDAGCASGELVRDFRRLGVKAYGIEKNQDILKKSVIPQFCTEMDLLDMSGIKNETFDIIYVNSLMYIYPHLVEGILKEFHRICNKAVYLCNPYLEEDYSNTFHDPSRVFLATKTWWTKQFQEANFEKSAENIYTKLHR